jgi:splicing factor 3A subunit 1
MLPQGLPGYPPDRVREKEKNNHKFSFLLPDDAYSNFYRWRLSEIKAGRGTAVSAGRVGEPVAEPEQEKPKGPKPPPEFRFSARMPNINALDLDVVKLTALFVAKRGKSFMTALSQREARNYQFDFLRPQHSLYQFFTRLVDQYTELLQTDGPDAAKLREERLAELEKNVKNKYHILEHAKQRAEWIKYQEEQKQKKEEEEEEEKLAYAQIDWHDFVVVETVLFTEADDQAELPPPTSLNDLQSASLEQKAMMSLQTQHKRIEEAMPTDEEAPTYYNAYPPVSQNVMPQPHYVPQPAQYPQQPIPVTSAQHSPFPTHSPTPVATPTAEDEERRIRERTESRAPSAVSTPPPQAAMPGQPPMRIRSDYVPRAQARRLNTGTAATATCPNCLQQIPIAEMEHHMRVELLDPRWKEQRAKAEERYASTNLSTADVANNLKRLASQRSDVFDPVPGAQSADSQMMDIDSEESRRKRVAMGLGPGMTMPPGGPPGAPGTAAAEMQRPGSLPPPPPPPMQNVNIEEQIRHIHQKFKQ